MSARLARPVAVLPSALAVALLLSQAGSALAHSYSVAYSQVDIADDQSAVTYRLRINLADLGEALGDPGREGTPAEVHREANRLTAYATTHITVSADNQPCAAAPAGVRVDGEFAEIAWTCSWSHPIGTLAIEYELFFEIDPNHTGLLRVLHRGEHAETPLTADGNRFVWELSAPPDSRLGAFFVSGVEHIWTGYDHILFLLGLLLVAVTVRHGAGPWEPRGVRAGLRYTLGIVTAFTVAHSITLIGAALGWFELPSRVVESCIAASIVFVAVENIVRREPRGRWVLTFAFGLIHGVGFASVLTPLLPEDEAVLPLLTFNLGVEAGQMAIVAALVPLLHLLARRSAPGYRRYLMMPVSAIIGLAGTLWLIQRAFAL